MTSIETVKPRRSMLAKLAMGSFVAFGLLAVAVAPASADDDDDDWRGNGKHWNNGHGNGKHWKKHRKKHWNHDHGYYQPAPVYYYPAPVYYAPPPPVYYQPAPVYYQPAPVYHYPNKPRVSVDLVFPIRID